MKADGSSQTRLTVSPFEDSMPAWSPDGTKIAFVSERTSNQEIFVMNADGTEQTNITNYGDQDLGPSWSPDGSKIAFYSLRNGYRIFAMNPDGSGLQDLTGDSNIGLLHPKWSPDGSSILYEVFATFPQIGVMNADGSNKRLITNESRDHTSPSWSPDGTKVVFTRDVFDPFSGNTDHELFLMNSDGSNITRLTNNPTTDNFPSWARPGGPRNPIDDSRNFIRQHYLDFLNREPDQGGLDYWTFNITQCGNDTRCIHNRRIDVSAAFFIELEFQETGYVVYRMHRAAFGILPASPTRANLLFTQFLNDRSQLVAGPGLTQSMTTFANNFVQRAEFLQRYPSNLSNAQFVNELFDTANLTPFATERQEQNDAMNQGKTRADVLLDVIGIAAFKTREYNGAFVLMQYFGYLRRDPDQGGYDFWLNVLNNQELNNYRGMVCAFLTSAEYQHRFGAAVTRTDHDCGP
jgi:hypothetical protein